MNNEYQVTPEAKAFRRLVSEHWESLSDPARTVLEEAHLTAHLYYMVSTYNFEVPGKFDRAIDRMHHAAAMITDREHKVLVEVWRAALTAAASVDPEDFETLVGRRAYAADLHGYYRMLSSMVETVLQEKRSAELEKAFLEELAEREAMDEEELPF